MAQVIRLAKRNCRNTKGHKGAGRPHGFAIKEKQQPGFFWIDQFTNWLTGSTGLDIAQPSKQPVEFLKIDK